MTIDNLSIGEKIALGEVGKRFPTPMIWLKVSNENHFMTTNVPQMPVFDESEDGNGRTSHGSNYFPDTSMFQYLNAKGDNWFTKAYENDVKCSFADCRGYLSMFSKFELDALKTQTISVPVPHGMRSRIGEKKSSLVECLVSVPSASQLGVEVAREDDKPFPYFTEHVNRCFSGTIMTRSPNCSYRYYSVHLPNMKVKYANPCDVTRTYPVIQLKGDVTVVHDDDVWILDGDDGSNTQNELLLILEG